MQRRLQLVVNPSAGGGRAARLLPSVEAALRASGVAPTVEIKEYDGHACTYRCTWVITL